MMARFAANNYQPVELDGRVVHPMLRVPAIAGTVIDVVWRTIASPRPQGLVFTVRKPGALGPEGYVGLLSFHGHAAPGLKLWADDFPKPDPILVLAAEPNAELQVSNQWRMPDGREDEWFNNYGMLVESQGPNVFLLRCSDGIHDAPDFRDLVVEVKLTHPETQASN